MITLDGRCSPSARWPCRAHAAPLAAGGADAGPLFVLVIAGCLLAAHWVTFFISVKVGGIAIATLELCQLSAFITLFGA